MLRIDTGNDFIQCDVNFRAFGSKLIMFKKIMCIGTDSVTCYNITGLRIEFEAKAQDATRK